jgi:hypothetical protein
VITLEIEPEREEDGRCLAETLERPGVLADGHDTAVSKVPAQAPARRLAAERLGHGEAGPHALSISFATA